MTESDARQAFAEHRYRNVVDQVSLLLAKADRSSRGKLHLLRLQAIDRGALFDVETREKEALAAVASPSDAIDVRLALGRIALRRGDFANALRLGVNMKSLLSPTDHARRAQALRLEAMAKWSQGALHESISLHTAAIKLCADAGDTVQQALALNDRGLVRGYVGDYQNALADHEKANTLLSGAATGTGRDEAQAQVENDLGFALWNLGRHNEALNSLLQSLYGRKALEDTYGLGITYNNVGNVHRSCGRTEQAVSNYERALELCQASGNLLYEAIALNNLGQLSFDAGRFAEAESQLQDALSLTQRIGDKIRQADNYGNLGAVYLRLNHFERAMEVLGVAVDMRRQQRDLAYLVLDLSAQAVAQASLGLKSDAHDTVAEVESALLQGQLGIEQPQAVHLHLCWTHRLLGERDAAQKQQELAEASMRALASKLNDEDAAAFLNNVLVNREIAALSAE